MAEQTERARLRLNPSRENSERQWATDYGAYLEPIREQMNIKLYRWAKPFPDRLGGSTGGNVYLWRMSKQRLLQS